MDKLKVAIGSVFTEFDGPSQHIFAIKKFSNHKVQEVPSRLMRRVLLNYKTGERWERGVNLFRNLYPRSNLIKLNDVLHSHNDPWFIKLCSDMKSLNKKWIHTYHSMYFDQDYPDGCQDWQKEVNRSLINEASKADIRICISHWLHDILLEKYNIDTQVIPNAYDAGACAIANPDNFIKRFQIKDYALFVGHYGHVKNPSLFIKLASTMPDTQFVMIGLWAEDVIVRKRHPGPIPPNIHFLGHMSHSHVLDAIAASKMLVMTSKREGIPTVLLEAMGMAKNVVAPNHSGCKEVIQSNKYGFLFDLDSFEDLFECTQKALVSSNTGIKAREMVKQIYSWETVIKQLDSVYVN